MTTNLFDLNFGRWEVILIFLVPACINLGIFLYTFLFLEKTRTISYFTVFVFLLTLWQTSDALIKMSCTAIAAAEWNKIAWLLVLFIIPCGILFILRFAGWFKRKFYKPVTALLFLPPFIFFLLIEARLDKHAIVKSDHLYWITNPEPTTITICILIWVSIGALAMLGLLWLCYFKTERRSLKSRQALLLASGLTLPVICGIVFEVIVPLISDFNDLPITTPLLTIFSITSVIAIKRYKIFDYSPRHQWVEIINSMNEGILIVDKNDCIMYANETFCRLTEYGFNEMDGKTARELFLICNHRKKEIETVLENSMTGESCQFETELRTKSGRSIWVLVSASPYRDRSGKVIGTIGVQTDITESVKAKKKIEFDKRNTDALINSTTDLMWSVDVDIKLITANYAFVEMIKAMTGITLTPGDSPLLKGCFPKQILVKWEQFYKRALIGETFTIEEYSDIPTEIYTEISLNPIFQDKKVIGAACYSRNITKSKLDEFERKKITDDLIRRNKDLEQFSYIISHNLRAPVATILGLSELIQAKGLPASDNTKCIKGLALSAKKLDETIIDLNNILKVRGEISEKRKFVDLSDIVDDIKDTFRYVIENEDAIIKIDFSQIDELFTIKSYLYSIFYNLISNSIKYRKQNQIPIIEITSFMQNNNVILVFKDNCMGIDLSIHSESIFGLYKRFHTSVEGKGIGLFMVKTQVETLGGKISLKSEVDKGTEITLEFKAA